MSIKKKKTLKSYIYERDNRKCRFCGQKLLFKQVSLDHYLPRSKSGPDDVFNLVLSCRKCNKFKKSTIPNDYQETFINLWQKGVEDKVISSKLKIKHDDLISLVQEVNKLEDINKYVVFQSPDYRFYTQNNQIIKIIRLANSSQMDDT